MVPQLNYGVSWEVITGGDGDTPSTGCSTFPNRDKSSNCDREDNSDHSSPPPKPIDQLILECML